MRSNPGRPTRPDDSTTRSRIRDAAVLLFGRGGYDATSLRVIAQHAGVSAGLVIHHFGSKEQLRAACDEHIVEAILGRKESLAGSDLASTMQRWLADVDSFRPDLDYLSRMITDGSDSGDRLFDSLVDRTEKMLDDGEAAGIMTASSDRRMRAVLVATYGLVPLIFERHIGRALGEPGLSERAIRRMTIPTLELYTGGLYASDTTLEAAKQALDMSAPSGSSTAQEGTDGLRD